MQITPTTLLGLAMFVYALTWVPDKYRPTWSRSLKPWQALIGLVALVMALCIVANPEFLALGLLGDSAFFDLLVLAISFQLQMVASRVLGHLNTGLAKARRFAALRMYVIGSLLLFVCADVISTIQKIAHRISS